MRPRIRTPTRSIVALSGDKKEPGILLRDPPNPRTHDQDHEHIPNPHPSTVFTRLRVENPIRRSTDTPPTLHSTALHRTPPHSTPGPATPDATYQLPSYGPARQARLVSGRELELCSVRCIVM
ncbi:hypothetical protein BO86DRAFT_125222 [Aspergillus japonicus CBS 114.51]|uniref:Uncharacterized protein n=1 Tax=Aspergillus japonicus CBS 114.51 TaxID=1448312 RepID=A0A8T8WYB2_ASPJA|nr:hypothetical protein BO86DRAFT_125222 [Aspergillus japonicus CBS 114.51]RAH80630.1 hypothetical protein BO86DRAFT_125222 [Aspergillus japonicus CBS 114.51]